MSAALVEQFCEIRPRHTVKLLARALGVSPRSAKRYKAEPELFPESRAVDLLRAIEQEERILEDRREERRMQREAVRNEIQARLGLDRPGLDLPSVGGGDGLAGADIRSLGSSVPNAGYRAERLPR